MSTQLSDMVPTSERDRIGELLDRARRIETKVSVVMEKIGIETRKDKPIWGERGLEIPSMDVSLKDILSAAPHRASQEPFKIWHKGVYVAKVGLP